MRGQFGTDGLHGLTHLRKAFVHLCEVSCQIVHRRPSLIFDLLNPAFDTAVLDVQALVDFLSECRQRLLNPGSGRSLPLIEGFEACFDLGHLLIHAHDLLVQFCRLLLVQDCQPLLSVLPQTAHLIFDSSLQGLDILFGPFDAPFDLRQIHLTKAAQIAVELGSQLPRLALLALVVLDQLFHLHERLLSLALGLPQLLDLGF